VDHNRVDICARHATTKSAQRADHSPADTSTTLAKEEGLRVPFIFLPLSILMANIGRDKSSNCGPCKSAVQASLYVIESFISPKDALTFHRMQQRSEGANFTIHIQPLLPLN
jgi:hypothetical protein